MLCVIIDLTLLGPSTRNVGKGVLRYFGTESTMNLLFPLIFDNNIVCIKLQLVPSQYMYIFQIYLPCTNHRLEVYSKCIDALYDLFNTYCDKGIVLILGDINAKLNKGVTSLRDKTSNGLLE